ncbi:MAG TPA: hypothetical protein VFA76_05865 [Terriglobales bacterium]|nr:hypothetical protein [Terriglobales bacterium]
MKKQTLIVASFCLVFGLVSAHAQAGGIQANVPFSFAASGKTFPAGEYTMIATPHQVKIQDANGKTVAMILANEVSGRTGGANGRIIFHCYREGCFLSELWSPVQENGKQLLVSRTEARLAMEERGNYFAVMGGKPQK